MKKLLVLLLVLFNLSLLAQTNSVPKIFSTTFPVPPWPDERWGLIRNPLGGIYAEGRAYSDNTNAAGRIQIRGPFSGLMTSIEGTIFRAAPGFSETIKFTISGYLGSPNYDWNALSVKLERSRSDLGDLKVTGGYTMLNGEIYPTVQIGEDNTIWGKYLGVVIDKVYATNGNWGDSLLEGWNISMTTGDPSGILHHSTVLEAGKIATLQEVTDKANSTTNAIMITGKNKPSGYPNGKGVYLQQGPNYATLETYDWSQTLGAPLVINPEGGRVGIGLYNPTEQLEVNGNVKVSGSTLFMGNNSGVLYSDVNNIALFHDGGFLINDRNNQQAKFAVSPAGTGYFAGNLGIGTAAPSYKVQVVGGHNNTNFNLHFADPAVNQRADLTLWASEPGWTYTGTGIGNNVYNSPTSAGVMRIDPGKGGSYIRLLDQEIKINLVKGDGSHLSALEVAPTGNTGLGTSSFGYSIPGRKVFAINGESKGALIEFQSDHVSKGYVNVSELGSAELYGNTEVALSTNGVRVLSINNSHNVGIGTSPSLTERLSVEGNIRAKGIKVDPQSVPDYVFKPEYKLRPLSEVEAFVKVNSHLPEVPSEADVKKSGLELGEMSTTLLKKVEELTLYLIELKKENESLKAAMKQIMQKMEGK